MTHRKINQRGYKFYVLVGGKIESGWEYREDALDQIKELPDPSSGKVFTGATLRTRGIDPDYNSSWLTNAAVSATRAPIVHSGHRVSDFNTLDDLVGHAQKELGATHTSGSDAHTRIYFPRGGQYQYEEATVWRKGGYWHAQGPGARTGVNRLPAGAKPIGGQSRRAAEPSRRNVRDYAAIDNRGRTTAGPFKTYGDAKHAAGPAGSVKFVPSGPSGRMSERRSAHHVPERAKRPARRPR